MFLSICEVAFRRKKIIYIRLNNFFRRTDIYDGGHEIWQCIPSVKSIITLVALIISIGNERLALWHAFHLIHICNTKNDCLKMDQIIHRESNIGEKCKNMCVYGAHTMGSQLNKDYVS